jgi:hypothetical protein
LAASKTEDATTMEIDNKIPADRTQLQELIWKEATKVHKSMIKEEVSNQLCTKMEMGGHGASRKKRKRWEGNKATAPTARLKQKILINCHVLANEPSNTEVKPPCATAICNQTRQRSVEEGCCKSLSTKKKTGSNNRNSWSYPLSPRLSSTPLDLPR